MKLQKIISGLLAFMLWSCILFFSALLAHNAILYFTHGGEYGILPEKALARKDLLWNISFYTHLPAGILCLFAPIFLFGRRLLKKGIGLHRKVGKLYVWVTLVLVCPTGMYLALYAKGGLITQCGFMLQGVLLALFTYKGYQAIMHGNKTEHVQYMIRSYAVATVVLSFRIFHILFFLWNVPYQDNYAISQWLGLSGNALLAEAIIIFMDLKTKNSLHLKSTTL
jgi:hypothetical protein